MFNLLYKLVNQLKFSETLRKTAASTLDSTSGGSGDSRRNNFLTRLEKQFEFNDLKKVLKIEFCESIIKEDEKLNVQSITQWLENY